jgi:hypothetical protein
MPNEFKVKNGLVVDQGGANITGSSAISGSLGILSSGSSVFTVDGTSGRLFSVDDSLSGSLFSVNTAAGLPIMEAFSDNTVRIGQYGQKALFVSQSNVGFGKEASLGAKVDVSGSVLVTGSLSVTSGITGSLFGTASWAQNAVTSSYTLTASVVTGTVDSASYAFTASSAISASQAQTASYVLNTISASYAFTASSAVNSTNALTASSADNFVVRQSITASNALINGTITAQTLVVQTITASTEYVTGSTIFGSLLTNTHDFTGSVRITGSLTVNGSSAILTNQTSSMSVLSSSYAVSSSNATTSSYSFTSSYAINMTVSGGLTDVDYIQFDTASTAADAIGRLKYDSGEGTLQLGLAGGNVIANIGEDLYQYVYNSTGTSLTKGQVVYISGSQGNRIAVKLASATAEQGSANTLGFVAETILSGAEGWVQTEGNLRRLNTTGLIGGDLIFLSTTPGAYTQSIPTPPNHSVRLGYAERIDATQGSIYIKIDNGYELRELHDVIDTSTTASYGDLLVKSGSVWRNSKQLTGSYGLTGSLRATTINTTYLTASGNNYPTNVGTSSYFLQTDGSGNLSWNYVRSVLESVKNIGPTTLVKGTPVYVTSSVGNTAEVVKADAASASLMPATYILNETLTAGQQGLGIVLGFINNIDTSTFAESDEVYVAAGGGYTNVQPTGSVLIQPLGTVVRVDSTNGSIMVSNTGLTNSLPNINPGYAWIGDSTWLPTAVSTSSFHVTSASYSVTSSYAASTAPTFIDNFVTVGLPGSSTQFNSIKAAVDSITDASANNTYTVKVYPGVYIEDTITLKSYIAVKGESSTSTVVSASNASASVFVMADQTMVIDMQIQGSTAPSASAIYYSSPTTPQTNAIAYAENIRFGTNFTNATCAGSGSGNCILQCSNVKYGGFTDASLKSFDIGFRVTGSGGSIGRMQLRNVTSTNGGVAGTDNNQIFALADAPGCTFIVNGCLLTRATGTARGTAFKVYNGGQLRLTAVNFQRWINGIWAPQTGSAPSIDAIALNFENCTTDVLIEHTGSTGKVSGTDNFLKTQIALAAPLYEVGQDPRRITVGTKGADFTSISASVAWISGSNENNRYVIEVGPGQFTEKTIDLTGKPYVSIVGSNIQTTQIFPSSSNQHIVKMGVNNELSFLSLANAGPGYSAIYVDDIGDFAQVHKISIYDSDTGITVLANSQDTQFYAEYVDINGTYTYGSYVSSSNGASVSANIENYYLFPSASATIGNFVTGPSSSLSLYTAKFLGDSTANSTAIRLENGAQLEGAAIDIQGWDYGYVVPNVGTGPNFRVVGSMIHESTTYDFDVQNTTARGRYQGVSNHEKINNVSEDFYWNFLDDADGENDVTRKLSVTFADGTHTDATTLIFRGSPMGVLGGGEITISGSLTITTATGFGYLHDPINPEVFKRFDWVDGDITLSPNTNNYIYINSNGILSAAGSTPNYAQNIILGRVVTNSTGIEFIDQSPWNAEHTANAISKFNREALGPVFAEGSIVTEDVTPFKLDVTQGSYFFSENNFLPAGTSSINLTQYYQSASVWARYTSSVVPNNVYASGSALVPMSASAYTKHTVYLVGDGADEEYFLVINDNQYSSLVATENASLPTIPTYFNDGVVPLAAVYVQSGSANITQIQDIRPIIGFRAAGVNASSVHGNLLGLTADDHLQYLRVDGFRETTGDLGLGGNDLYNVASISASAITASGASITDIKAVSITGSLLGNATSADSSTSASYAFTASSAISSSYAYTASSAVFAFTASNARSASLSISASYAFTASSAISASQAQTASYVLNAISSSYAYTASSAVSAFTASSSVSSSLAISASYAFTASSAISSSYAFTASSAISAFTASSARSASLSISASYAFTASSAISAFTASSAVNSTNALTASSADNFVVRQSITASNALINGTITAQTLVVQTITSSTDFVTGSTRFGSQLSNTHVFTGSVSITGSLTVIGRATIQDLTGSLFGTASWATNFITSSVTSASYAFTASSAISSSYAYTASSAISASYVLNAISSSYAFTASSAVSAFTASSAVSSSQAISASYAFTASSAISSSFASNTISASYAFTASSAISSSYAYTASSAISAFTASSSVSSSLAISASYAFTASSAISAYTASSAVSSSQAISASYAFTASSAISAFTASSARSASLAISASYAFTASSAISSSYALTASYALNSIPAFPYSGSAQITGSLGITGSVNASQGFTGSLFGTASWATNFLTSSVTSASYAFTASSAISSSFAGNTISSSYAFTASSAISSSFAGNTISASYAYTASSAVSSSLAQTASFVNTLNQNVLITGSLTVGTSSLGATENTLILGPAPAGGAGEGGQILLQAKGDSGYTSASMLDNWQNQTRLLRGSNQGSDAIVTQWDMHTKQVSFPAYNSVSAFAGTAVANLAVDTNGNILTVSTSGGTVFPYTGIAHINGGLVVTGSITSSGAIHSLANGAMYFRGGDDAELWDINVANTVGIYGQQDQTVASIKLGNNGGILSGRSGSIGIGTTLPVSGTLHVEGNIFAASLTGSLFGTASWAQNFITSSVTSASYAFTASSAVSSSFAGSAISSSYAFTASSAISSSFANNTISASYAFTASSAVSSSYSFTASSAVSAFTASSAVSASLSISASYAFTASSAVSAFTASSAISSSLAISSSYAFTASSAVSAFTASSAVNATNALTASSADNFVVRQSITASNALINGTITAQTLVVQTITSSIDFVTGSTRFGSLLTNTHDFTGSVRITGSLGVIGRATITDLTGSLFGTASWATNFLTSSVTSASYAFTASSAISSSYAFTASSAVSAFTASSAVSSSLAISASYAFTASSAVSAFTASSAVSSSQAISSSYAFTASSAISAFTASSAVSASLSVSASYAFTASSAISSSYAFTASSAISAFTASSARSASLSISASYAFTASSAISASLSISASYAFTASSAISSSYAFTASSAISAFTASSARSASLSISASYAFTASSAISASYVTGSIFTSVNPALSASYALTASYALNGGGGGGGLVTKAGSVANSSFTGNPKKATVTFSTAFGSTNYAITVTGEDARSWTIESKAVGSFVINANSNTGLSGTTYWIATAYGETT